MISIERKILGEYLKTIMSEGDKCSVSMASLDFSPEGCHAFSSNGVSGESMTFTVKGTLKPSAFSVLPKEVETYNINNLGEFLSITEALDGIISIEKQNNFIVISDTKGKTVYYILTADEYIPKAKEVKLEFKNGTIMEVDIFREIVSNAKKLGIKTYKITVKDKVMKISCGDDKSTHLEKRIKIDMPDVICGFIAGFDAVFDNLPGPKITLYLMENAPLKATSETGNMRIEYVLAPAAV